MFDLNESLDIAFSIIIFMTRRRYENFKGFFLLLFTEQPKSTGNRT